MDEQRDDQRRPPTTDPAARHPIEIDLYCLECGYNLRGLFGDPARCPECGFLNPIGDVEIPAPLISRELRRLETAPAIAAGALALLAFLTIAMLPALSDAAFVPELACPAALMLLSVLTWVIAASRFRASCRGQPGWVGVFARYQLVALLLVILVSGVFLGVALLVRARTGPQFTERAQNAYCLAMVPVCAAVLSAIRWGLKPIHPWLKGPMEQLQRGVAAEIARQRSRKQLSRRRRRGSAG